MKMEDLPSERYFTDVKTKDDYDSFVKTGMAWEFEPNLPSSWKEHIEMLVFRNKIVEGGE